MTDSTSSQNTGTTFVSQILDGGDSHTERLGIEYLLRFMRSTRSQSVTAYKICEAFESAYTDEIDGFPANPPIQTAEETKAKKASELDDFEDEENLPAGFSKAQKRYPSRKRGMENKVDEKDWTRLQNFLEEKLAELPNEPPSNLWQNLGLLSESLKFTEQEAALLRVLYVMEYSDTLQSIIGPATDHNDKVAASALRLAGFAETAENAKAFSHALSPNGKFVRYDVIESSGTNTRFPTISMDTEDVLERDLLTPEVIRKEFVGPPTKALLTYDDIKDLDIRPQIDHAITLLKGAAEKGIVGVNVRLDGPTGGGKTELAKLIIQEAGLTGYSIGESEDFGASATSSTYNEVDGSSSTDTVHRTSESERRFGELLRAHALLADDQSSVVFFDEIEDLLTKGNDRKESGSLASKIALNLFMERNVRPNLLCANNPENFDGYIHSRTTFSIYVDYPPIQVRKKIWERQMEIMGVELDDATVTKVARKYDASPRQIANAIKSVKATDEGLAAIEISLPESARILTGSRTNLLDTSAVSDLYAPALVNMQTEERSTPARLVERGLQHIPFSLLVQGPKGSGVASLVRQIGEGIMRNMNEYSMTDLAVDSPQISAEAKIASAFDDATNRRRFLVLHDLDALSPEPTRQTSWKEEPIVKSFIEMARRHELPFAATTCKTSENLTFPGSIKALFSDQIELGNMTEQQIHEGFEHFFGLKFPTVPEIKGLPELVVGDFAAVRRKLQRMESERTNPEFIVATLKEAAKNRLDFADGMKMGF